MQFPNNFPKFPQKNFDDIVEKTDKILRQGLWLEFTQLNLKTCIDFYSFFLIQYT